MKLLTRCHHAGQNGYVKRGKAPVQVDDEHLVRLAKANGLTLDQAREAVR